MGEFAPSVLGVLVKQCKLPAMEAMKIVPALLAAGVRDEDTLRDLPEKQLAKRVKDAKLRRKITIAVRGKPAVRKVDGTSIIQENRGTEVKASGRLGGIVPAPARTFVENELLATYNIVVNRSPVLILWAAIVANVRGYDWSSSLSLAQAAADWYAQRKSEYWGISSSREDAGTTDDRPKTCEIELMRVKVQALPISNENIGFRALDSAGRTIPAAKPAGYLTKNIGIKMDVLCDVLYRLAEAMPREELESGNSTFQAYERFRPDVMKGAAGWGARSRVKMEQILNLILVYEKRIAVRILEQHEDSLELKAEAKETETQVKGNP
eukprot:Plantae.Rhodophyta-Purpureofilum_apyrenoidigerum.ctg3050.p1 GENE.Plantae.Rhodophyta-Purpureofilum_apyrenoidigerum.ctg3050~~Plantae.Rhodophyta-Purpureofilum_apyrenoidigerum.ctg3050.p1  ORF type:complete len:324 (-),score=53.93 Plantae.Rhodophyta-Purpureofilum_apyrenoidigerum.ctg3050:546-1517(-)